jgi:hypothetical protein
VQNCAEMIKIVTADLCRSVTLPEKIEGKNFMISAQNFKKIKFCEDF